MISSWSNGDLGLPRAIEIADRYAGTGAISENREIDEGGRCRKVLNVRIVDVLVPVVERIKAVERDRAASGNVVRGGSADVGGVDRQRIGAAHLPIAVDR